MPFSLILTTVSTPTQAKKIARYLVENKLAACVNIIPKITSIYNWKDEITEDTELLLFIKTRKSLFKDVKKAVLGLHPYEVPEIIMLPIDKGHKEYLNWIEEETLSG